MQRKLQYTLVILAPCKVYVGFCNIVVTSLREQKLVITFPLFGPSEDQQSPKGTDQGRYSQANWWFELIHRGFECILKLSFPKPWRRAFGSKQHSWSSLLPLCYLR